jgi:hypothetical protein
VLDHRWGAAVAGHASDGGSPVALEKRVNCFTVTCVPGLCAVIMAGSYCSYGHLVELIPEKKKASAIWLRPEL